LVGHEYSLVPVVMADHTLAWQMPRRDALFCSMYNTFCM